MDHPPRTQFELSEYERDQPKGPLEELNSRRRLSIESRVMMFNSFSEVGDKVPPAAPDDEQIAEYAPLLVASLRRLVADCEWAIDRLGGIDTSLVVRTSLIAATKALDEAAAWGKEKSSDAVA